ncbi:MAG: cyclase family protein [Calditrichaeota bacterium]|nr:cyclase family protein [Calditrichota bacterium]RQV92527.1 MAG: cyclase family protein [bacterium]
MKRPIIHDVSLPLHSDLPVWPGDPSPVIVKHEVTIAGSPLISSRVSISLHWGTHVDAPAHFNPEGWTIDLIPPDILTGSVQVIELSGVRQITSHILRNLHLSDAGRYFFKTDNSRFWAEFPLRFHRNFTAFTEDAATYLKSIRSKLIGIDYLSLDLYDATDLPVHKILFSDNIVGVEGLDLREVSAGMYQVVCLPLRIRQGDGSPARVLLFDNIQD